MIKILNWASQGILGFIALILISCVYESSAEVLLQGTNTVDKGFKVEGPGTDLSCGKYTVTLTGGWANSNIMAGVISSASVTTIQAEYSSYSTMQDVVDGVKPRLITGSECTFTEFGSSATCSKTVTLMPSESYYVGILNSDDPTVAFSYKIESCEVESASSSFYLQTGSGISYSSFSGTCPAADACSTACTQGGYTATVGPSSVIFNPKTATISTLNDCNCYTINLLGGTYSGNEFTTTLDSLPFTVTTTATTVTASYSGCSTMYTIDGTGGVSSPGFTLTGLLGLTSAMVIAIVLA